MADDSRGPSRVAPVSPSSVGFGTLVVDVAGSRPLLEIPMGEDLDLLQRLLANTEAGPPTSLAFYVESSEARGVGAIGGHGTEEAGVVVITGDALLAFGLVSSMRASFVVASSSKLRTGGRLSCPSWITPLGRLLFWVSHCGIHYYRSIA